MNYSDLCSIKIDVRWDGDIRKDGKASYIADMYYSCSGGDKRDETCVKDALCNFSSEELGDTVRRLIDNKTESRKKQMENKNDNEIIEDILKTYPQLNKEYLLQGDLYGENTSHKKILFFRRMAKEKRSYVDAITYALLCTWFGYDIGFHDAMVFDGHVRKFLGMGVFDLDNVEHGLPSDVVFAIIQQTGLDIEMDNFEIGFEEPRFDWVKEDSKKEAVHE